MMLADILIIVFVSIGVLCFLIGWFEVGYMANAPRRARTPHAARGGSVIGNLLRRVVGLPDKKPHVDVDSMVARYNEIDSLKRRIDAIDRRLEDQTRLCTFGDNTFALIVANRQLTDLRTQLVARLQALEEEK